MSSIRVATVQSDLVWEDIAANLRHFEAKIAGIANKEIDVVVLPEMFTTGFSMNTTLAEPMNGLAVQWMAKIAATYKFAVCGSIMIKSADDKVHNKLIWMNVDGTCHTYDKHHLFSIGQENQYFQPGREKVIIPFKGFRIQLLICYDLRFPVWIRRTKQADFDAIFIVANWPEKRVEHWKALLKARAIENQCYVVAVNRVGLDGNQINHNGSSCVIEPTGLVTYEQLHQEDVQVHVLDKELVSSYRKEFPVMNDADDFSLV